MRSARAARCTGVEPRWPCSTGAALTEEMSSETATSVSGGIRWAMSSSSSVGRPDDPEAHDRAEERVLVGGDHACHPGRRHPLDLELPGGQRGEPLVSDAHASRTACSLREVDAHPRHPALVAEHRCCRLHHHGVADLVRRRDRLVDRAASP